MTPMQVFDYNKYPVRVVEQDGEPWWILNDVCAALDVHNPRKVAQRLDEDEKGVTKSYTLGGEQEMTIINEPGLYSVILRSNKPEAKEFKRWLTHEVIPSIRKTGSYGTQSSELTNTILTELTRATTALADSISTINARLTTLEQRTNTAENKVLTALPAVSETETGFEELPSRAKKTRWMNDLHITVSKIVKNEGMTERSVLHTAYEIFEDEMNIVLEEVRLEVMERYDFKRCSTATAIFYTKELRRPCEIMLARIAATSIADYQETLDLKKGR